jgi:hypothetical protein
VIP